MWINTSAERVGKVFFTVFKILLLSTAPAHPERWRGLVSGLAWRDIAERIADAKYSRAIKLVMRYALTLDPAAAGKPVAVLLAVMAGYGGQQVSFQASLLLALGKILNY